MTDSEWKYFKDFCNRFKNQIEEWNKKAFNLLSVKQKAMEFFNNAKYLSNKILSL